MNRHPASAAPGVRDALLGHLAELCGALEGLRSHAVVLDRVGAEVGARLAAGHRLLAVGNGGSAAHAQHLTSELVGRYVTERRPLSAIALHGETSALTAIVNDYGVEAMFARQVEAHGRPGDVLVAFSTSGRSRNVIAAVEAARRLGMTSFALTGPGPNPLVDAADAHVAVDVERTAIIQDVHQVAVHLLCTAIEAAVCEAAASHRRAVPAP